jgi:outer membrane lipoprotein-sorting protein
VGRLVADLRVARLRTQVSGPNLLSSEGIFMKLRVTLALSMSLLLALAAFGVEAIQNGEALVRAMHSRYENTWYETMTFTQKSTTYNPDGTTKVATWYEAGSLPGKLRIDFGEPSEGNAAILVDSTAYFFQKGKQTSTRPYMNMLLVLGFDVYRQPPEATLGELKQEGMDVAKFHEDEWQGEPVYVVGADKGDLKSKQFWVEKKRLLFVRIIEPDQRDPSAIEDTRFTDYLPTGKAFIAARVEVYSNDKLTFTEEYTEIKTGMKLDPATFDPTKFAAAPSAK